MTYKLKKDHILALRTCDKDLKAHGGFQWREKGIVTAPDFKPITECGNGLHALEWGIGDGGLLDWSAEAKWLIVEVKQSDVIQLDGKIKFPSCKVVHCGDQLSATSFLLDVNSTLQGVVGSFVKAGNYGTATAGNYGTATAGNYGTATAGYRGTATAGDAGVLIITWWDGGKHRRSIGHVTDGGLEPNVKYRLNDKGEFVKV